VVKSGHGKTCQVLNFYFKGHFMKVFLSSTYIDLIDHRKAVASALRTMDEDVGHMEIFGAREAEATIVSLEELDKCDVLVGVYAYRYGTVPAGSKTSVTEQEYLYAMSKKIPVLVFVVDESHPWPPKLMDKSQTEVEKFKSKATAEHTPDYFTSPDNLAQKVVSSVGRLAKKLVQKPSPNPQSPITNHQLPTGSTLPHQEFFFGRVDELKIIASALSPESRTWGALIDGPGGIGKTALAIKAVHDAPAELFERKIFITAKVRELTAEGEAKLTDFTRPTYLAMLDELGKELGADGLEKLAPDERPNELRLALAGKKALIIFDNLETLPEDERTRLFQFLSRLPEGNKAIVTSRRRTDVDARIVRLDRLARDEALQLIAELAAKYPRLARASQKEHEDLYEITQGNPLFIRWLAGQLGRDGSQCRTIAEACAFIDKAPKGNDPLEYIFGDLLETFTADETKVLAALTYFTLPAKLKWIADMTDLPARATETALEDLTDRSILTSDLSAQTYFLPPLTAKFIRTRRPEAVTQTGDVLTDRAYALAMQCGGWDNYEGFRTLDAEWDFVSAALPRLLTGDNDRLQAVCEELFQFLNFTGKWDDSIWLNEQAEARALATADKENAGRRAYATGYAYQLRNQPTEVLACAARAAEHWLDSVPYNKATAIQLRGHGHRLKEDYPAAIATYCEAIDIYRSISPESDVIAVALNDQASAESKNEDYPAAERDYREALRIAKIVKYQEGVAYITGNLALLALDREQWAEAESLTREALALAEKVGRQELIASNCHRLAEALVRAHGRAPQPAPLQEALSLSRRAVEIYTHLRSPRLQSAQATLAEIEKALGKA
jgi:tetratricopeptide (TPR) repeat protein